MLGNPRQSWILESTPRIPDSGFQVLDSSLCQWNLDSGFQMRFSAIPASWAVFWILKPRIPDSTSKNFPDSRNQIPRLHEVKSRKALNSALHETRDFEMYDGDDNENVKKAIDWISKTTTLHVHLACLDNFITVTARLQQENA